jgi:hypothetical protein
VQVTLSFDRRAFMQLMFKISMRKGVCVREVRDGLLLWDTLLADGLLSAQASTLESAFAFIKEFTIDGGTIAASSWAVRDGRFVLDVWDWNECFCPNPPVLAEIIAPLGFIPPAAMPLAS